MEEITRWVNILSPFLVIFISWKIQNNKFIRDETKRVLQETYKKCCELEGIVNKRTSHKKDNDKLDEFLEFIELNRMYYSSELDSLLFKYYESADRRVNILVQIPKVSLEVYKYAIMKIIRKEIGIYVFDHRKWKLLIVLMWVLWYECLFIYFWKIT